MESEVKVPTECNLKCIVSRVGTSFALFGVMIAMMFVFLIGFGVNNSAVLGLANSLSSTDLSNGVSIYDYFGKVYKQIEEATGESTSTSFWDMYSLVEPSLYIPAIICTVAAAGVIVSVITLGVLSIIKLVRKLLGKEVRDAEKFAMGTVISYILGSAVLKVFNHASIEAHMMSYSTSTGIQNVDISVVCTYNTATLAGIALCAISLGICLACHIAKKGAELKQCDTLARGIFTVVSVALVGVIAHFATCALYTTANSSSGGMMYTAMSMSDLAQLRAKNIGGTSEPFDAMYFMYTLLMLWQLVILGVAFAVLIEQIKNIFENKEGTSLVLNIALASVCVVYLVLAIVAINEPVQESELTNITFTPCIAALIIAVFNLCTSIARKLIKVKACAGATETTAETNAEATNA